MARDYKYTDLEKGNIRILQIQPELDEGLLQVSLQNVALKGIENDFVALSWTWGKEPKPGDRRQIKVDGWSLHIWPALWEVLDAFRHQQGPLNLWIDAICINQDKDASREKNSQIPMMAEIYRSAKEVYVWLGPSAHRSDYVMKTIASQTEEAYQSLPFVVGLIQILARPWWTRTWIVQEYILNKTSPKLFCGQAPSVSADLMLRIWRRKATRDMVPYMDPKYWSILPKLGSLYWLHHLRDSRHNPEGVRLERNLRNGLLWLKAFEVTEPRDKIYGMLGLIEAEHRERYVKSVGIHTNKAAAEVYLDATVYLLQYEKTSTIFYDFPVGRDNVIEAPSWVPNFNTSILPAVAPIVRLGDVTSNRLDNPLDCVTFSENRRTMSVRGRVLGRVIDSIVVGDKTIPGWCDHDQLSTFVRMPHLLHTIQNMVGHNRSIIALKQLRLEPLWKTLIAGGYSSIADEDLKDEAGCQQKFDETMAIPLPSSSKLPPEGITWKDFIPETPLTPPKDLESHNYFMKLSHLSKQAPRILAKIQQTLTSGRTFFTSDNGYYGIGEPGTRDKDLIVLLFPDHFIPFILRERNGAHEMVGVAYLPESMIEAAIAEIELDRTLVQSFTIV